MPNECAVCYVSDINYLLPSIVSASGLRKFVPVNEADIYLFLVDQQAHIKEMNDVLKSLNIQVLSMDSKVYSGFDKDKYNKTHVPPAALGRLFMDDMLPNSCRRIVYIDGDTWIRSDPSELIETEVPEGKFAAACDITSFRAKDMTSRGQHVRAYMKKLGFDHPANYFNSGVFSTSRKTWKKIAADAYKYFVENTAACVNQDQSALNAVMDDRRIRLSAKWNFQTQFRYLGLEKTLNPNIYHFTEPLKPWMGPYGPWKDLHDSYKAAMTPFESLNLPVKKADAATINAHDHLTWKKALLRKSPLITKVTSMYLGIGAYEKSAWL